MVIFRSIISSQTSRLTSSSLLLFNRFLPQALSSLGGGGGAAMASLALNLIRKDTDAGKLLGAWSILSGICGSVMGPILFSMTFVKTVDTLPESIFIVGLSECKTDALIPSEYASTVLILLFKSSPEFIFLSQVSSSPPSLFSCSSRLDLLNLFLLYLLRSQRLQRKWRLLSRLLPNHQRITKTLALVEVLLLDLNLLQSRNLDSNEPPQERSSISQLLRELERPIQQTL